MILLTRLKNSGRVNARAAKSECEMNETVRNKSKKINAPSTGCPERDLETGKRRGRMRSHQVVDTRLSDFPNEIHYSLLLTKPREARKAHR